jgi:hypothetical protein
LALLAAYPEYQQQAVEELNGVWPSENNTTNNANVFQSSTTMDDYAQFPFLLACYSETLRLFPPVQMIPKIAAQDTMISVDASNVAYTEGTKRPATTPVASPTSPGASLFEVDSAESDAQTSFAIKKGTFIFVDPPGVRK